MDPLNVECMSCGKALPVSEALTISIPVPSAERGMAWTEADAVKVRLPRDGETVDAFLRPPVNSIALAGDCVLCIVCSERCRRDLGEAFIQALADQWPDRVTGTARTRTGPASAEPDDEDEDDEEESPLSVCTWCVRTLRDGDEPLPIPLVLSTPPEPGQYFVEFSIDGHPILGIVAQPGSAFANLGAHCIVIVCGPHCETALMEVLRQEDARRRESPRRPGRKPRVRAMRLETPKTIH